MCSSATKKSSLSGNRFADMAFFNNVLDPCVPNEVDQNLGACNPGRDELYPFYRFFQFFYKKKNSFKKILSTGKYLFANIEKKIFLLIPIKPTV